MLAQYVERLGHNRDTGWGLFLWGANSTGKTFAAAAVLKEAVRKGHTAFCIMADRLKVAYIEPERFDRDYTITQRVETVDFLLLEDLGKEYSGKGSGWAELCFENLIRKRSRELRPTIITTNLTPDAFRARYKDSAAAIVMEAMVPVEMCGEDLRKMAARRKHGEMSKNINARGSRR